MLNKICFICFMLIFVFLYLYIKIESFAIPPTNSTISAQLYSEIARVLNVSPRRVNNLKYSGDISSGSLNVTFFIVEPNSIETKNDEPNSTDTEKLALQLVADNNFKVFINGFNIVLYKMPTPTINQSTYFDNKVLKKINTYIDNVYVAVPNDISLTNFYKLGFDSNFNIQPQIVPLNPISTIAYQ